MGPSRGTRLGRMWVGAVLTPLAIGSSTAAMLAAATGLAMLILVLVVAAVALGSAFARNAERRRACLRTLHALLSLAPGTYGRHQGSADSGRQLATGKPPRSQSLSSPKEPPQEAPVLPRPEERLKRSGWL
jgi:hypothetical protein